METFTPSMCFPKHLSLFVFHGGSLSTLQVLGLPAHSILVHKIYLTLQHSLWLLLKECVLQLVEALPGHCTILVGQHVDRG